MIRMRILRVAAVGGLIAGTLAVAVPAGADLDATLPDNQIVQCNGGNTISTLNPTLKDGDAKYTKSATKLSDGTKTQFLTNDPIPANALVCAVDSGIKTNQAGQDAKYVLDNQTNGQNLTQVGPTAKTSGVLSGSSTCFGEDPIPASKTYPNAYPVQGKLIWKFDQLDAASKQIQMQQYIRLGITPPYTGNTTLNVTGIVIKGPGLGGTVSATITFYPTSSTKNIDPVGCQVAGGLDTIPGNTSLSELWVHGVDGPDAGTAVDPWSITIPS